MDYPEGLQLMGGSICLSHIDDPVLLSHVADQATEHECTYCPRTAADSEPPFAVSMDYVAPHVFEVMNWLYDDEAEAWGPEDWQERHSTAYVVEDCTIGDFEPSVIEMVRADIVAAVATPQQWVSAGIDEIFSFSWEQFTETVKQRSRFVYVGSKSTRPGHENEPPYVLSRFLDGLHAYVQNEMFTAIRPGEKLYRGRMAEDVSALRSEVEKSPGEKLGPPPPGAAAAGRLNPEGVGLFYSATTVDCAMAEIAFHSPFNDGLIGAFEVKRELRILDFTHKPKLPSVYAHDQRQRFLFARFIDEFVKRLTQPVLLAGKERIDYVPTQVIAEYLRWVPETKIDGLAWESHLDPNGKNVGVFVSFGDEVQSDPPVRDDSKAAAVLLKFLGPRPATLTLSNGDLSEHRVTRSVAVHSRFPTP